MGLLKDAIMGGAVIKALRLSDRPVIESPNTCRIVEMKHQGLGSSWKVTYVTNQNPNVKRHFKINKNVKMVTTGREKWKIHWN
jgi:hypothetical protein